MNAVPLTSLWIPVLLSAVVVFLASSIVHMLLTYHRTDFGKLPSEAEVSDALRRFNLPPGDYIMPHCSSPAEMKTLSSPRNGVGTAHDRRSGCLMAWKPLVQCSLLRRRELLRRLFDLRAVVFGAVTFAFPDRQHEAFIGYAMGQWPNVICISEAPNGNQRHHRRLDLRPPDRRCVRLARPTGTTLIFAAVMFCALEGGACATGADATRKA